jgi:two-component system chemotaxis response regulator CheB
MRPATILIVDHNILVRRAISTVLGECKELSIRWVADELASIEEEIAQHNPDVVLISIDNLSSRGFTLLSTLRLQFPKLPVIAITPRNNKGAEAAIHALRLGAVDFITKPEHKNMILFAERHLAKRIKPIIEVAVKVADDQYDLDRELAESIEHPQKMFEDIHETLFANTTADIVVIGGCSGGVHALFQLVAALPDQVSAPMVAVQHLPRIYTKTLAEKLDAISNVTIREAQKGVELKAGDMWIAKGGYQCEVGQSGCSNTLDIHRGYRENSMRPSIDVLFRSVARNYGERALAIMLSGAGCDGLSAAEEIHRQGGQVIVQDPRTAMVPEILLSAIRKGITKEYFSTTELAHQILQRTKRIAVESSATASHSDEAMGNTFTL